MFVDVLSNGKIILLYVSFSSFKKIMSVILQVTIHIQKNLLKYG